MNTSFRYISTLCFIVLTLLTSSLLIAHYATAQNPETGTPVDFVGTIDSINQNTLVIDGISVDFANVQITSTLHVGMTIRVQGLQVQANIVIAQSITIIITTQTTPTPTATVGVPPPGDDDDGNGDREQCPRSQGYWKNHGANWPVTSLILGSQIYSQAELLALLNREVSSDASINLVHQLIAAKLNVAQGFGADPVSATIAQMDSILAGYDGKLPYGVAPSSTEGQVMITGAGVLDTYNNGRLGGCLTTPTPTATGTQTVTATPTGTLATATPTSTATMPPIVVIEGPVTSITINVIVINNITIQLDPNNPLVAAIQIGDTIHIEGDLIIGSNNTVIIVAVVVVFVDIDVYVLDDEYFRDDEDCGNAPPPWAPAHGWRARCEGGGGDDDGMGMGDDDD
jgi:hypothetical protein